jgi:uncharacterized protein
MSINNAKKIVDELMTQNDLENVEFLWHGGEPLLRGIEFYQNIFEYQKSIVKVNPLNSGTQFNRI